MRKKALWLGVLAILALSFPFLTYGEERLDGKYLSFSDQAAKKLINEYGDYAFQAFRKHPWLVKIIREAKKDFQPKDVATAFPTEIFEFHNGKKVVIFSGCTAHDCGGTVNVIVYDPELKKAYVLRETREQTLFKIYGDPPDNIKRLLIYHYKHR